MLFSLIKTVLEYIAQTKIYGIIPLDIVMHFVLGAALFYLFLKTFKHRLPAFLCILALAIFKEIFDWDIMMRNQLYFEPVKDILVTLVGAGMCLVPVSRIKTISLQSLFQLKLRRQHNNTQF